MAARHRPRWWKKRRGQARCTTAATRGRRQDAWLSWRIPGWLSGAPGLSRRSGAPEYARLARRGHTPQVTPGTLERRMFNALWVFSPKGCAQKTGAIESRRLEVPRACKSLLAADLVVARVDEGRDVVVQFLQRRDVGVHHVAGRIERVRDVLAQAFRDRHVLQLVNRRIERRREIIEAAVHHHLEVRVVLHRA